VCRVRRPDKGRFSTRSIESDGKADRAFLSDPHPGFSSVRCVRPEANRKVLVTERNKVLWRNADPVTDLLRRACWSLMAKNMTGIVS